MNYIVVSAGISTAVGFFVWMFVEHVLNLSYLGVFVGPILGILVGGAVFAALASRPALFGAEVPAGVTVSATEKQWAWGFLIALAVLGAISHSCTTIEKESFEQKLGKDVPSMYSSRAEIPRASTNLPQSSGTLNVSAHGESRLILPIDGQYPSVTGFGKFRVHNVFEGGGGCAFGEAHCVNGRRLKGYYVGNESDVPVTVTFTFKPG